MPQANSVHIYIEMNIMKRILRLVLSASTTPHTPVSVSVWFSHPASLITPVCFWVSGCEQANAGGLEAVCPIWQKHALKADKKSWRTRETSALSSRIDPLCITAAGTRDLQKNLQRRWDEMLKTRSVKYSQFLFKTRCLMLETIARCTSEGRKMVRTVMRT